MASSGRRRAVIWTLILTVAFIEFVVRGPYRSLAGRENVGDFIALYASARAWTNGENPYDRTILNRIVTPARPGLTDPRGRLTTSVYPPPSLMALAPLAALPWPVARVAWVGILLVAVAMGSWALIRLGGLASWRAGALALVAIVLVLAPVHTGIAHGQPVIVAVAFIAWAFVFLSAGHHEASGLALAAALICKPQIAALFVAHMVVRRHWRAALWATAGYGAVVLLSVVWLWVHAVPWIDQLNANMQLELVGGGLDILSPSSRQMIDLRHVVGPFFERTNAWIVSMAVALALALAFAQRARKAASHQDVLLVAGVSVVTLLLGYHRFHDAALLVFPITWALTQFRGGGRTRAATFILAAIAPFLVPGGVLLAPYVPVQSTTMVVLVVQHQTWLLVAIFIVLWSMTRESGASREPAGTDGT